MSWLIEISITPVASANPMNVTAAWIRKRKPGSTRPPTFLTLFEVLSWNVIEPLMSRSIALPKPEPAASEIVVLITRPSASKRIAPVKLSWPMSPSLSLATAVNCTNVGLISIVKLPETSSGPTSILPPRKIRKPAAIVTSPMSMPGGSPASWSESWYWLGSSGAIARAGVVLLDQERLEHVVAARRVDLDEQRAADLQRCRRRGETNSDDAADDLRARPVRNSRSSEPETAPTYWISPRDRARDPHAARVDAVKDTKPASVSTLASRIEPEMLPWT